VLSFIAIRLIDIAVQGKLGYIWTFDFYSKVFLIEMGLFLVPALMMLRRNVRKNRGALFMSAVLLVLAGTVYRFDTYLVAYLPTTGWVYFPSLGELLLSACLASTGIAVYLVMIKLFPILSGVRPRKKPAAAEHTTTVQA
jgi:Ni/Fe-hydrogenase subunit HybB-like protein